MYWTECLCPQNLWSEAGTLAPHFGGIERVHRETWSDIEQCGLTRRVVLFFVLLQCTLLEQSLLWTKMIWSRTLQIPIASSRWKWYWLGEAMQECGLCPKEHRSRVRP